MKHTPRSINFKNENCTKIGNVGVPGRRIYTAHKKQLFLKFFFSNSGAVHIFCRYI